MRSRFAVLVAAVCVSLAHAGETTFELVPKSKPFRLGFADPREIRMVIGVEGGDRLQCAVGNYFSLLGLTSRDAAGQEEWTAHFGIEGGGYFSLRQGKSATFPLETVDGLAGLYWEARRGPWQGQLRFTHVSAHLADGSTGTATPYSRETVIVRAGWEPRRGGHLYSGFRWLANTIPAVRPWGFQIGGTAFLPWEGAKIVPFTALDLQWRQEAPAILSVSGQLGIAFNNPPESFHSFRIFYGYYSGQDPRGQYFTQVFTSHTLGIEMQI